MPIIKRYNNRKLYDTHAKCYVTLFELADMIRRGDDITVLDHANGEDITSQIQAQIIFEEQRQARTGLPLNVLTNVIQASNQTLKQLRTSLLLPDKDARMDSEIERRVQALVERGDLSAKQGNQILEKLLSVPPVTRASGELKLERALEKRGTPTHNDIERLSAQIEALARELESLSGKKSKGKSTKKRAAS